MHFASPRFRTRLRHRESGPVDSGELRWLQTLALVFLVPPTWLPPPLGVGTFSLHWRFPSIRLLLIRRPPSFWKAWRFPPILDLR
jgi:hypothetical protein